MFGAVFVNIKVSLFEMWNQFHFMDHVGGRNFLSVPFLAPQPYCARVLKTSKFDLVREMELID